MPLRHHNNLKNTLISRDFSAITDCESMQDLFEAVDNISLSRRDQDAVVTSQCLYSFFHFVSMLASKQCFSARIKKIKLQT